MHCLRVLVSQLRRPIKYQSVFVNPHRNEIAQATRFYGSEINDDSDTIIKELCNGDKELEKKIKVLMLEVEVMRQDGRCAPDCITKDQWDNLLRLPTRNQRTNYLTFLFKLEKKKENIKAKKEARRKEIEDTPLEVTREYPDDQLYGIKHLTMFLRIRDQSINMFDNYRALMAMIYGQSLIIDSSYEEHMVYRETVNAAKQMTFLFGDNRLHKDPFNIHICNVNQTGAFMKQLRKNIPTLDDPWFPVNIHTNSYLDLFPKEKLVYLTPHCREELTCFDHDAVYIVGCMVDKINNQPLSLAKAKRDGLKMAKLPLDRYIEWAPGSKKNLNINHMILILLDLKLTGDWEFALRHIPNRKRMETKILAMQKKLSKISYSDEDFKSFRSVRTSRVLSINEKKLKSRKSLYDDDSI